MGPSKHKPVVYFYDEEVRIGDVHMRVFGVVCVHMRVFGVVCYAFGHA